MWKEEDTFPPVHLAIKHSYHVLLRLECAQVLQNTKVSLQLGIELVLGSNMSVGC